jgi:hypothetical protein
MMMASNRCVNTLALAGLIVLGSMLPLVSPARAADALYAVSTRGSTAVTVGDAGRILRSPLAPHNGNWDLAGQVVIAPLRGVAAGAGDYFAVGDYGTIVQSTDPTGQGYSWMGVNSDTALGLTGIGHGTSRMVAVGDSSVVVISTNLDGGAWQRVPKINIPSTKPLKALGWNLYYVVAVGDSGTVVWSRSGNLITWDKTTDIPTTRDLLGVASEPVGSPSPRFWAVGKGGTILASESKPEGGWSLQGSPVTVDLHSVAFYRLLPDDTLIGVAVGDGGTILRSIGAQTWTQVESGTQRDLYGVSYTGSGTGGGFVAVGDENTILWSPTGIVWNDVLVPTEKTTWGKIRGAWRTSESAR